MDDLTQQAFAGPQSPMLAGPPQTPQPQPELTRAATADYLDRANWNPDQARALAAKERLTNLGVHPAVVAQAVPQSAPVASAVPAAASIPPRQPVRSASPVAPVAQPVTPKPIDFSDLGGRPVRPSPKMAAQPAAPVASQGKIDFSDLGGKPVAPSTLADTSPMGEPAATPPAEDSGHGALHQIGGFLQGSGENIVGAVKGVHDLFQGPQNDEENSIQEALKAQPGGELWNRLGLAGYRFLHGVNDTMNQAETAGKLGAKEAKESGSAGAGLLTDMENEPFIGKATKLSEQGEYGKALGDILTSIALMRAGGKGASKLPAAAEEAEAAIPKPSTVAGTTLPETVGQAAAKTNPIGIGSDVKGMEDVASKLPMSQPLRKVGQAQQGAAREVLATKAATTGADVSKAPEAIEQNIANAAQKAREAGSAKYEAIGQAAKDADVSKAVEAAQSILTDETVSKILPKQAREALGKVSQSLAERESIAKQIYGKGFNDLEPTKQAEVGKAMTGGQEPAGVTDILKARSELAQAANGAKDAADRFQMHKALESFDGAIDDTLKAHDAKTGANVSSDLVEAKKLWSQKYAFEEFRDGLQNLMQDQPHGGARQINGASFQKLINNLDPRGSTGTTPLQRMFPGDAQSVTDLHELADYMGRNQSHAGGMATGMAKMRLLGLKASAVGLLANVSGFSWLMSKPGLARAALTVFKGGVNSAKITAAVGTLNSAAEQSAQQDQSDAKPSGQGFQRPEMEEHKTAGMAAAAEAPNTPDHLRPHLRKMAGTSVPEKGAIVMLPGGQRATVEYSSPHDKTPVVKVRMEDGKAIRYIGRKEVDSLKPAER